MTAAPEQLEAAVGGLSSVEAADRLRQYGPNSIKPTSRTRWLPLLAAQFNTPIILLLIFAAGLSFVLGERSDALIIAMIVGLSGLLGFWQEKNAGDAVSRLLNLVRVKASVWRDGHVVEVPVDEIVPGDVVVLNAGNLVPGDGRIIESRDLFLDEASLTGETFPVEKGSDAESRAPHARPADRLYRGTHVVSGTARMLILHTGKQTELGGIAERLRLRPPETEFEHGVRRFGYLLLEVTLLLMLAIFACNVFLARPVLDSLLFALALAVGLTPQLLPAIISVNLARGARHMAARRVIVKRLAAIENFGSMNVLCCDKTGTLTEGTVVLEVAVDPAGRASERVLGRAALNAFFQTGYTNPMDAAILARSPVDAAAWRKLDEQPYDFVRRRMSVLLSNGATPLMITKGAVANVLAVCTQAENEEGRNVDLAGLRPAINEQVQQFCERGWRVLAVACRAIDTQRIGREYETGMTFIGLLAFSDPLRANIGATLADLRSAGIALKIVTGDQRLVSLEIGRQAGFNQPRLITGEELRSMSSDALRRRAADIDIFAEVEPSQKERIIGALHKAGKVVGYLGDGINDASALHVADVGISVAGAADAAQDAADIVLLEKNLAVLCDGVREGRITFANTSKYVFMATSANFGNMFSMAAASLILPFLPLLPKQILLLNLLTDLPEMTIATDRVDAEWTARPRGWDLGFIRRFMVSFGLLSSVFDLLTFFVLLHMLRATPGEFRTAWFVESVTSAALIVLVIRSPQRLGRSRPSWPLLAATLATTAVAMVLPFSALAPALGLSPLAPRTFALILLIVAVYGASAEWTKRSFYRHASVSGA